MTEEKPVHEMVQKLIELEEGGSFSQFKGGVFAAWGSVKFLYHNPKLWPNVAIPALINLAVFIVTAGLLLWNADWFFFDRPTEGPWYYYVLIVLWWIFRILLYPLLVVVAYFLTMMLAGIVASPFNDALSERAEAVFMGDFVKGEEGWKALVVGGVKGILAAAATTIPRVILMILLGLIPGAGPILAAVVGAYFIALEYTDTALTRRRYGTRQKMRTIWKHRRIAMGFGLGANMLLVIPLLNFLSMPIAVIGGTALAIALDRFESGSGVT